MVTSCTDKFNYLHPSQASTQVEFLELEMQGQRVCIFFKGTCYPPEWLHGFSFPPVVFYSLVFTNTESFQKVFANLIRGQQCLISLQLLPRLNFFTCADWSFVSLVNCLFVSFVHFLLRGLKFSYRLDRIFYQNICLPYAYTQFFLFICLFTLLCWFLKVHFYLCN